MAKKQKIYAVKKGTQVGIFSTWEECQAATKGFSGAEYKSFETEDEAKAYINDEDIVMLNEIKPRLQAGKVVAFVDGSFDKTKGYYGSGIVIFTPDDRTIELSQKGNNANYVEQSNIVGEIIAAMAAIDWAWKNGFEHISLFYDLEGLEKWATGAFKANNSLTQLYKKRIDEKAGLINIEFVKVKGHSNNRYNDRADTLARGAIFDNKIFKDAAGNGGYIISPVKEDDITTLLGELKDEIVGFDYMVVDEQGKKIWSIQHDKNRLSLTLHNNIKLVVQGKKSNLFQLITTAIIENIKCDDFIQVLRTAYAITIDKSRVENEFNNELPALTAIKLPDNITILLKQAIINLNNPAYNDEEFTMYTFPALRSLEGVLKYNLSKCKIKMGEKERFNMFDKVNGIYKLQLSCIAGVSKEDAEKIENCYNHLHNNRHTLFHFGVIIGVIDTNTRLLKTKKEADEIIKNTLKVINENYII